MFLNSHYFFEKSKKFKKTREFQEKTLKFHESSWKLQEIIRNSKKCLGMSKNSWKFQEILGKSKKHLEKNQWNSVEIPFIYWFCFAGFLYTARQYPRPRRDPVLNRTPCFFPDFYPIFWFFQNFENSKKRFFGKSVNF